jgi:hypothetical protein
MKFVLPFVLLLAISCSTATQKIRDNQMVGGVCEQKFKETKLHKGQYIWQKVGETTTTGMSYLVTGLGYSTDFAVSFTSGVIAGVGLCSPIIALDALTSQNGTQISNVSGECIGEVGVFAGEYLNPKLGPKAFQGTKSWRCPNVDPVAFGLVKVADCYQDMGQRALARAQLQKITHSEVFRTCLSKDARKKIEEKLDRFPYK